mmetsp:Transcript_95940/g.249917  ORF Transcript_95940/g.249917 Transcript_95940/m.249917 type:complete len:207 (-) Transcript_95940:253-873(-)
MSSAPARTARGTRSPRAAAAPPRQQLPTGATTARPPNCGPSPRWTPAAGSGASGARRPRSRSTAPPRGSGRLTRGCGAAPMSRSAAAATEMMASTAQWETRIRSKGGPTRRRRTAARTSKSAAATVKAPSSTTVATGANSPPWPTGPSRSRSTAAYTRALAAWSRRSSRASAAWPPRSGPGISCRSPSSAAAAPSRRWSCPGAGAC